MHWDAYTGFSVVSGILLIIAAALPGHSGTERAWSVLGGAVFVVYGLYVAHQTSGTFYFSVWIFIVPFLALGYLVYTMVKRGSGAGDAPDPEPRPDDTTAPPAI